MTPRSAQIAYRALFVAFIVWASVQTIMAVAAGAAHAGMNPHFVFILAGCEILAAAAFMWRKIELWAAGALILIFAIASLHLALRGLLPAELIFYAGTVLFLLSLSRGAEAAARP
jgi:hypothetical protein